MLTRLSLEALMVANSLVGTKETSPNRGDTIDLISREFGYTGVAYCALFAMYCYGKAAKILGRTVVFPKTASSQTLYGWANDLHLIYHDPTLVEPGDIVIWRKWKLWQGHVGIVIDVDVPNLKFITIEGNTSNSDYGSQSDGDGIYKRVRYMRKVDFSMDGFYLRGFIDMKAYDRLNWNDSLNKGKVVII